MNKTNILILMQSMNVGGVERALVSLLSVIPKDRYSIDLILSKKEGNFLKQIPEYVNIYEAPYKKRIRAGEGIGEISRYLVKDRHYVTWLKLLVGIIVKKCFKSDKYITDTIYDSRDKKYDYLFNFAGVNTLTHLMSKNIYRADYKYIWVHGDSDAEGFIRYSNVYEMYDHIFCVSQSVTEKIKEFMPQIAYRADTIYNEIDKKGIIRQSDEEEGLVRLKDETILLTVGRLDICKGYDIAIDACSKLLSDGYKVKWYVIGEGIERDNLENAISQKQLRDNFILLGLKANPYPYYKTADIYVQTSISEGYCITLAEAKVFNKPIVTTDFSGAAEQIINGETGFVVTTDYMNIAEKIESLIDNDETRDKFRDTLKKEQKGSSFDKLEQIMNNDRK